MAIRIQADDGVSNALPDEEIYLPGAVKGDDEEGPYEFVFPRVGRLIRLQRRLRGMNIMDAAAIEVEGVMEWLAKGFGPDAWEHIDARLNDDGDLLDDEHMLKLFQLLNEGETGRPTTSSNGASRQPWKNRSTAALSPVASASEN